MAEYRYRASDLGYAWREKIEKGKRNGVIQCRTSEEVDPDNYGDVEEYITELRRVAATMDEPRISMEMEYGRYGDRDRDVVRIAGWRDATDTEVAVKRAELESARELERQRDEQLAEQLKARRPELFS